MKQPQKLIGENSGDEIAVKRYAEKEGIAIGGEKGDGLAMGSACHLSFVRSAVTHILIESRELVWHKKTATLVEKQRENLYVTLRPSRAIEMDRQQKTVPRPPGSQATIGLVTAASCVLEKRGDCQSSMS